ncbi:MAG: sigma-70 family RNA polymerase sigma factor [Myxococcales bacterium]|nr:sigma-70 family RNA polymerase sigma factor [Myxococcales bacterium]
MPDHDDRAAIEAASRGDASGLAALYDAYAPLLFGVAQRILGDRSLAEEVLRDVFLEIWTKSASYDASGCSVRVWLLMHLRQRSLERLRSGKVGKMVSMEDTQIAYVVGDDEDPALTPAREQIQRIIDLLPPKQRNMLQLAYFEGLSSEQIGARTKVPTTRVASEIANALSVIRDAYSE